MKVLLALASHEVQHVGSLRSFYQIHIQDGDERADEWKTRGDVAREKFVGHLLKNDAYGPDDAILLLDADQRHPVDLLDKLRAHDLDMVCAHYYRRETRPVQSLCYELGDGRFPFMPFLDPPTEGLHEIAVTGFGCVLIKKKVLQAVAATLPPGMSPIAIGPLPEVVGDYGNWGPDYRFFYLARKAGFKLWLDASVESLHGVTLWLGHKSARKLIDYEGWANAAHDLLEQRLELYGVTPEAFKQRKRVLEARQRHLVAEFEEAKAAWPNDDGKRDELSGALYIMTGRLKEMDAWIEMSEKYPRVEHPGQLPTTDNTPAQDILDGESATQRSSAYRENAIELVQELPNVPSNGRH